MELKLNFKSAIICFLVIFFLSTQAFSFTIQKLVEWPSLADDAIDIDDEDKLIFHSMGDRIRLINKDNLSFRSGIRIKTTDSIHAIHCDAKNDKLYAAGGKSGVFIIDYSNPDNPVQISNISDFPDDPGFLQGKERDYINAASLKVNQNYLYIADNAYGMRIYDIKNPDSPVYLGGYRQDGKSPDLTTGGYFDLEHFNFNSKDYLCILDVYFGLRIFDVTKPSSFNNPVDKSKDVKEPEEDPDPVAEKDLKTAFFNSISLVRDIKARKIDNEWFLFITTRASTEEKSAVFRFKLFDDSGEILKTPINKGRCDELIKGNSVEVDNSNNKGYALIADGDKGIKIVDIINSTGETDQGVEIYKVAASLETGFKYAYSLKLSGARVLMADLLKGITQIDITNPLTPVKGDATGSFLKARSIDKSTKVIDKDNNLELKILGVALSGDNISGFSFFDIEEDSAPLLITSFDTNSPLFIKDFNGKFLAVSEDKILIYGYKDTDPDTKVKKILVSIETELGIAYKTTSLSSYSDYIYTGTETGINIHSYSSNNISFKNKFLEGVNIESIYTDESSKLLFAGTDLGILIFNISDPLNPVKSGEYKTNEKVSNIYSGEGILFAAHGSTITTLSISDLKKISLINTIELKENINTIFADKEFLFAGIENGVKIYSKSTESSPSYLFKHSTQGNVAEIILKNSHLYSADSAGGFSISEYDKDSGSDQGPFEPKSGDSSACFIKSLL